jgi:hypothetical protein
MIGYIDDLIIIANSDRNLQAGIEHAEKQVEVGRQLAKDLALAPIKTRKLTSDKRYSYYSNNAIKFLGITLNIEDLNIGIDTRSGNVIEQIGNLKTLTDPTEVIRKAFGKCINHNKVAESEETKLKAKTLRNDTYNLIKEHLPYLNTTTKSNTPTSRLYYGYPNELILKLFTRQP